MKSVFRILGMIHALDKRLLPATVVNEICLTLPTYIDTLLGAYVLDGLIAGLGLRAMLPVIFAMLGLRVLIRGIGEISQQIVWSREGLMHGLFMAKKSDKTLGMDYEELCSPAVNKLRDRMNQDDMHGWGITDVYYYFSEGLGGNISMVTALIIVVPMIQWSLGSLIYLAVTAAVLAVVATLRGKFLKHSQELADSYEKARSYASFYLWGGGVDYKMGKDIRVFGAIPMIEKAISEDKEEHEGRRRYVRYVRRTSAFNGAFGGLLQASSYVYVVLNALRGALSAGEVVKFASSLYSFWGSLSNLMTMSAEMTQASKRMEDTLEFLALPEKPGGTRSPESAEKYSFEFRNVSFTYPGSGKEALKNVSCELTQGERVAIVGLNGSGKTTFIKLLCRLYHPTEGEILLNGVNIEEYDFDEYIRLLSVVFQDFSLFSFRLGENVASAENWDEEKLRSVLNTSGFGERFAALEKGGETVLYKNFEEDGVDISGGEAQKIALARALYKDAPFMILDEPTAALDPVAEYEIYSRFNGFTGGKGAIYISHRLSSCVFCDRIMVFDSGHIVQRGTHAELLAESGLYAELWEAQAQYYK